MRAANGIFDDTSERKVNQIKSEFLVFLDREQSGLLQKIEEEKDLTKEIINKLDSSIKGYREAYSHHYRQTQK